MSISWKIHALNFFYWESTSEEELRVCYDSCNAMDNLRQNYSLRLEQLMWTIVTIFFIQLRAFMSTNTIQSILVHQKIHILHILKGSAWSCLLAVLTSLENTALFMYVKTGTYREKKFLFFTGILYTFSKTLLHCKGSVRRFYFGLWIPSPDSKVF
jgi:hypothetical protein